VVSRRKSARLSSMRDSVINHVIEKLYSAKYIINFRNYLIKKYKITISKTPGIVY